MNQLTPCLVVLLAPYAPCFRMESFATWNLVVFGWLLCNERRTISGVWQATGLSGVNHHDKVYSFFLSAVWSWEEVGLILARQVIHYFVTSGPVQIVVDDTLVHKRGPKVRLGAFYIDPVLSTKNHKVTRFGLNWIVLCIIVKSPLRSDRLFSLPVFWSVFRNKNTPNHQKRTVLAAEMVRKLAIAFPDREFQLAVDNAYINKSMLSGIPKNLIVIGPLQWKSVLHYLPTPRKPGQRGATRKKGERLPSLKSIMTNALLYPARRVWVELPKTRKLLLVREVRNVLWYHSCKESPISVFLIHDPSGAWLDMALLVTAPKMKVKDAITCYCHRWSIEVMFHESKQLLGLNDAHVRQESSVERVHPMAWFLTTLVFLWYHQEGHAGEQLKRDRPWYPQKKTPTFSDMLGAVRLQLWRKWISDESGQAQPSPEFLEFLLRTLARTG